MHVLPLIGFACSLALLAAASHARPPRDTATAVADAVERNYYDAARGTQIARDLRAAALRGEFDAATDPRDLATALTDVLEPLDGHFQVQWAPPEAATDAPAARAEPPSVVDTGVRRVEVLPGNLGYLDLAFFAGFEFEDAGAPPRLAIDAALQLLAWSDAVIVDLRNNGGGSPAMVGYLTSAFTPPGADIYNTFHFRSGTRSEAPAKFHPAPRLEVPLYVLVSGRTGSAAEALAYTLKNAGRATVVGERSAGAANPGGMVDAGEGFAVFVSDGSPVSPVTKTNWEGDGVVPDLAVAAPQALHTARIHALQRLLARTSGPAPGVAARWALEALQAEDALRSGGATVIELAPFAGTYGELHVVQVDGRLVLRQGRRPERALLPLPQGGFVDAVDPLRRVAFERDAQGAVVALELQFADGDRRRFRRAGTP
jgi:hypothetical protein